MVSAIGDRSTLRGATRLAPAGATEPYPDCGTLPRAFFPRLLPRLRGLPPAGADAPRDLTRSAGAELVSGPVASMVGGACGVVQFCASFGRRLACGLACVRVRASRTPHTRRLTEQCQPWRQWTAANSPLGARATGLARVLRALVEPYWSPRLGGGGRGRMGDRAAPPCASHAVKDRATQGLHGAQLVCVCTNRVRTHRAANWRRSHRTTSKQRSVRLVAKRQDPPIGGRYHSNGSRYSRTFSHRHTSRSQHEVLCVDELLGDWVPSELGPRRTE